MFSLEAHLKFYTDPLVDTLERGEKIYCTTERVVRHINIGKIVDVEKIIRMDGWCWRVTPEGDHVNGPVVNNANTEWNAWHLGFIEGVDNVVALGRFQGTHGGLGNLANVRYSDQRALPVLENGVHNILVDSWFKAASWAMELFPAATDSDDVVTAKVALAEQRWNQRRAKTTLLAEGASRGYEQLTDLVEEGDLPEPVFGAFFNGDLLIPSGNVPERNHRTVATQERLERVTSKLPSAPEPRRSYLSVSTEVPLHDTQAEGVEGISKIAPHTVASAIRSHVDDYDVQVANYTLLPILRAAS